MIEHNIIVLEQHENLVVIRYGNPPEKLAESLEVLHTLQNANGAAAIRARDLTMIHRERLLKNGFYKRS